MPKQKKNRNNNIPGVMLYAKAPGLTSFSSLWSIKHALGTDKVGHTGTLDSFAEGLLVVLSGHLTHLVPHITGFKKTYQAVVCFGSETDTLDPGGKVVSTGPAAARESIENALGKFTGAILQVPPVYSALHVDGKRASDAIRDGNSVQMEPRQVFVYSNRLIDYKSPTETDPHSYALLEITCSKGTYIRALARDIARELGTFAHLSALRRTQVGPFKLEDSACYKNLSEFTIENGIKNDKFFADLRDNPPPPLAEKKYVKDSQETMDDIKNHLLAFTPQLASKCGFRIDQLKEECEKSYLNGRPLHGGMFKWLQRPQEDLNSEYDSPNEIAVFYQDMSFAGMIVRNDFKISYGFVVQKKVEQPEEDLKKKSSLKIYTWNQILDGQFPAEWKKKGCAITVGSFDGMHLGHKALVDSVTENKDLVPGVVTFNSSYHSFDGSCGGDVCSLDQKMDSANSMGLVFAIVIDFSPDFARIEGEDFIETLVEKCGMKFLAEGADFCCGYKGALNMAGLEVLSREKGFCLKKVDDVLFIGRRISSSRIRDSIFSGDFSSAKLMMGRDFSYDCSGFNFSVDVKPECLCATAKGSQILPKPGEYKVNLIFDGGSSVESVCRIGSEGSSIEVTVPPKMLVGSPMKKLRKILFL